MRELKSGLKIGPKTYDLVIAALAHAGEHEQVSYYCCSYAVCSAVAVDLAH
jgi:hypothetical protein